MPLIQCPDCGTAVSDKAPQCPRCGRPFAPPRTSLLQKSYIVGKATIIIGVFAIILSVLVAVLSPGSKAGIALGLFGFIVTPFGVVWAVVSKLAWGISQRAEK